MQKRRLPDDRFKKKRRMPKKNTSRLFLGIFPPEEYISYFRDVLRELDNVKRNIKTTPVDQLHLTVKFIGSEVSFASKDIIAEELSKYSGNFIKPEIKITGIQFGFPYQQDPQHVLAMIEETKDLKDLYNEIHNLIKSLELEDTIRWKGKNTDNFHITLARVKPKKARSIAREIGEYVKKVNIEPPEPFLAEYLDLVESTITSDGPVYRKVGRIKL